MHRQPHIHHRVYRRRPLVQNLSDIGRVPIEDLPSCIIYDTG
jgi:hypothetical protein